MTTFDDVIAHLVQRIRRGPAGGFVPRVSSRPAERCAHDGPRRHGAALSSYRDIYRCPASAWGADAGWMPEIPAPCPVAPRTAPPRPRRSATIPFRVFDEP